MAVTDPLARFGTPGYSMDGFLVFGDEHTCIGGGRPSHDDCTAEPIGYMEQLAANTRWYYCGPYLMVRMTQFAAPQYRFVYLRPQAARAYADIPDLPDVLRRQRRHL